MADDPNAWWMQESDPQVRALLQQLATGQLPDTFAYEVASQVPLFDNPNWPGYIPPPSYAPDVMAILNQLKARGAEAPFITANIPDFENGRVFDTTPPGAITPEMLDELPALVRKFPTQATPDPGFGFMDFLQTFGPVIFAAAAPAISAAAGGMAGAGAEAAGAAAPEAAGAAAPAAAGTAGAIGGAGGGAAAADILGGGVPELATSDLGAISGAGPIAGVGTAPSIATSDLGALSGAGSMTGAAPTSLSPAATSLASGLANTSPVTGQVNDIASELNPSTAGSNAFGSANGAADAFSGTSTAPATTGSTTFNFQTDPSIAGGAENSAFAPANLSTPAATGAGMEDLPFGPATGTFDLGSSSSSGLGGNILSFLKANPGLALSGGGLLLSQLTKPRIPNLSGVQDQLNNIGSTAKQLIASETTGVLPPGQEQMVQNAINDAKTQIRAKYANLGLSGSTMETQELNAVDERAVAERAQLAAQATQTGLNAAGLQDQIFNAIAGLTLQQDQGLQQALANFAGSAALGAAARGIQSV